MVKRFLDCVISAVLLALALPVLLIAALVVWIGSPGPVLFRQVRMGRGFQPFEILKLRTMAHAQRGLAYTLGPDPRITRFGRWLRRTKIDELPQLWNVLRGEMSLVGPRPVLPELTAEFRFHYRLLLRERPGLTDPASLKYSQEARLLEQSRDPLRFFKTVVTPDKIRISLEYMDRANLWTDAGTMVMTALICCFPRMQTVYGRLPDAAVELAPRLALDTVPGPYVQAAVARPAFVVSSSRLPVDGCVFSHELAALEARREQEAVPVREPMAKAGFKAGAEQARRRAGSPWNLLRQGISRQQSTAQETRESVSGL